MNFILPFTANQAHFRIGFQNSLLFLGSCFSDAIGGRCEDHKFQPLANPYGTLFNVSALSQNVKRALHSLELNEEDIVEVSNGFTYYGMHSEITAESKNELKKKVKGLDKQVFNFLKKDNSVVFITLGTAWVYERQKKIVANCHKQPAKLFQKRLMEVNETTELLSDLVEQLIHFNPTIKIVCTVSPVRHTKDGLFENNVSKGVLHNAVFSLQKHFPEVHYFPAYELVTDQLRDYRFYASDLIHPNQQAEDFVWEAFQEVFMDEGTKQAVSEVSKVVRQEKHKPFFPDSKEEKARLIKLGQEKERLSAKYGIVW